MSRWTLVNGLLLAAAVATGIAAVYTRHQSRNLYNELQRLEADRDQCSRTYLLVLQ